ncbi:hypothetical protein scyTo_0006189 [Scyliorhinus torazame]|uniref:Uncharacterized protein n=1 Tax=Scyliorhinus torazame TaxID=75743 RepID=A0A401PGE0_SCYTO|nr:hypothetical protein [Scyliorhinus torazame]
MITVPVRYKIIKLDRFMFYVAKGPGVKLFNELGFKLDPTGAHINDDAYDTYSAASFLIYWIRDQRALHALHVDASILSVMQNLRQLPFAILAEVLQDLK